MEKSTKLYLKMVDQISRYKIKNDIPISLKEFNMDKSKSASWPPNLKTMYKKLYQRVASAEQKSNKKLKQAGLKRDVLFDELLFELFWVSEVLKLPEVEKGAPGRVALLSQLVNQLSSISDRLGVRCASDKKKDLDEIGECRKLYDLITPLFQCITGLYDNDTSKCIRTTIDNFYAKSKASASASKEAEEMLFIP
jgi:hypothetical protein